MIPSVHDILHFEFLHDRRACSRALDGPGLQLLEVRGDGVPGADELFDGLDGGVDEVEDVLEGRSVFSVDELHGVWWRISGWMDVRRLVFRWRRGGCRWLDCE